jgi:hypothetical protein
MTRDKLKCSVLARMPCSRRIVASLDDLGMELLVIGNIQFLFVIEESVEFFSLEKVVNQSVRTFFAEYFKSLSDFDLTIGAVSNLLFEFQRFGKSGGGKRGKVREVKDQLIPIVFSVRDLEMYRVRERISNTVFLAWLVN